MLKGNIEQTLISTLTNSSKHDLPWHNFTTKNFSLIQILQTGLDQLATEDPKYDVAIVLLTAFDEESFFANALKRPFECSFNSLGKGNICENRLIYSTI